MYVRTDKSSTINDHTGIIISGDMYVASSEYFRLNNVAKYKHSKGSSSVSPPRSGDNGDYIHALSTTSAESALEGNGTSNTCGDSSGGCM